MIFTRLLLALWALSACCFAVAVPSVAAVPAASISPSPRPPAGVVGIPLEFGKNYTVEDVEMLRKDFLPVNTNSSHERSLDARDPSPLSKRDVRYTTWNAFYNFHCPRGGTMNRHMEWVVYEYSNNGNIMPAGTLNVDYFTAPMYHLVYTPDTYYNSIVHDYCLNFGNIVCSYRLRGSFHLQFSTDGIAPFYYETETFFQSSFAPGQASQPAVTETCVYVGSQHSCPDVSLTNFCTMNSVEYNIIKSV